MIDALPLLLGDDGYQISRSVRLRSSASAFFSRTPASAGNRKTWTWSGWVKVGTLGVNRGLFGAQTTAGTDANRLLMWLNSSDKIIVYEDISGAGNTYRLTTQVFRDPSAWYHFVIAFDTTQATAADRIKLYVNGSQITAFDTNNAPTLNRDTFVNAALSHSLGADRASSLIAFDGYLTDINFIDGQALTPAAFGETDAITGVWKPRRYTGTYGTNGFFLNFSDPSAATAAAIGKDYSGNGNNWTPNNISVTAGVTYDSMLDVPTPYADGGNGRGNYAVLNPLDKGGDNTVLNGNLAMHTPTSGGTAFVVRSSIAIPSSGKWYWEGSSAALNGNPANNAIFGVIAQSSALTSYLGSTATGYGYFANNGNKYNNGTATAYGATYTSTDVIGIAFDADAGTLTFYKNNVSQGTAFSGLTGTTYFAAVGNGGSGAYINFGQQGFAYTPPTGFRALNTQNLPEPTIVRGNRFFDATTYTGTGAAQNIVNSGAMQPDLVWIKSRSVAGSNHELYDAVRGATIFLSSNTTGAEGTLSQALTAFNSNGFALGNGTSSNSNSSGASLVAWQWREGATQGFDIVTWTGSGSSPQTISHSLGVAPRMMIVRPRNAVDAWYVYHASMGNTGGMVLNGTGAFGASAGYWNNTTPTSSAFTLGSFFGSTANFVAYLFSEVAGFSRFGSYTGNGSADGPFCFTGFQPRWIMIKRTDSTSDWIIKDTARSSFNAMNERIDANGAGAENSYFPIDVTSNGFKIRHAGADHNVNGGTYIYAAFASSPFKYSLAR